MTGYYCAACCRGGNVDNHDGAGALEHHRRDRPSCKATTFEIVSEAMGGLFGSLDYLDIDPAWPIADYEQAIALLAEWAELEGDRDVLEPDQSFVQHPGPLTADHHAHRLSHSHAHEWANLKRYGFEGVYTKGRFTKYVAVAWLLAGRHRYDQALVAAWDAAGRPAWSLIDFGAAAWLQAIFYAKKGLWVTAVNKGVDSDANRFGAWLAARNGVADRIRTFASDPASAWSEGLARPPDGYDVVYSTDVFEHIPPLPDGSPGWIPYASAMMRALKLGGIYFANAPLDYEPGVPHPTSYHPDHFTSPISLQQWLADNGCTQGNGGLWRKLG